MDETPSYDDLRTCTPASGSLQEDELSSFDGCQRIDGSVILRYGFSDRTNFRSMVVITGTLSGGGYVGDPLTLEGFDSLEVVEGRLGFLEDNLTNYSGVPKLWRVGSFHAHSIPELEDFRGLEALREVDGVFRITYNPKLRSLAGLEGLEHIHGDLTIGQNPQLPVSEIDAFLERVTVDGDVELW